MGSVRTAQVTTASSSVARSYLGSASSVLLLTAGAFMLANMYFIFMWAPTEAVMGHVQRIFYIHVPMAWLALEPT